MRNLILVMLFVLCAPLADAQPVQYQSRGELLYTTHCIACHNEQVHWRDKKLARDWRGLRAEVRRWQKVSGLRWSEDDIDAVTRYLNPIYYHYPAPY